MYTLQDLLTEDEFISSGPQERETAITGFFETLRGQSEEDAGVIDTQRDLAIKDYVTSAHADTKLDVLKNIRSEEFLSLDIADRSTTLDGFMDEAIKGADTKGGKELFDFYRKAKINVVKNHFTSDLEVTEELANGFIDKRLSGNTDLDIDPFLGEPLKGIPVQRDFSLQHRNVGTEDSYAVRELPSINGREYEFFFQDGSSSKTKFDGAMLPEEETAYVFDNHRESFSEPDRINDIAKSLSNAASSASLGMLTLGGAIEQGLTGDNRYAIASQEIAKSSREGLDEVYGVSGQTELGLRADHTPTAIKEGLINAGGHLAVTIATGAGASGPLALGKLGTSGALFTQNAMMEGQNAAEQAYGTIINEGGSTQEASREASRQFLINAPVSGTLETAGDMLLIGKIAPRIFNGLQRGLAGRIASRTANALLSVGPAEATTEVLQQISQNVASELYKEDPDVFEGIEESAVVGYIFGSAVGAVSARGGDAAPAVRELNGKPQTDGFSPDKIALQDEVEFIQEAELPGIPEAGGISIPLQEQEFIPVAEEVEFAPGVPEQTAPEAPTQTAPPTSVEEGAAPLTEEAPPVAESRIEEEQDDGQYDQTRFNQNFESDIFEDEDAHTAAFNERFGNAQREKDTFFSTYNFNPKEYYTFDGYSKALDEAFTLGDVAEMSDIIKMNSGKFSARYFKDNRSSDETKKAILRHILTGAPMPPGFGPTTPPQPDPAPPQPDPAPAPPSPPNYDVPPEYSGRSNQPPFDITSLVQLAKRLGSLPSVGRRLRKSYGVYKSKTKVINILEGLLRDPEFGGASFGSRDRAFDR